MLGRERFQAGRNDWKHQSGDGEEYKREVLKVWGPAHDDVVFVEEMQIGLMWMENGVGGERKVGGGVGKASREQVKEEKRNGARGLDLYSKK